MRGLQPPPDRTNLTVEEQRALVDRILASPLFEKSSRLSDFLRYICDRTLSGHPEEVHEQFVGHHVFDRPIDYNPADDNIVRVSARQLRTKLRQYFDTHGREERWRVEIPKGGYLPVFRERHPQAPNNGQAGPDARVNPRPHLLKWGAIPIIIAAVVLLVLGVWGWEQTRQTPAVSPTIDFFAGSKGPVQVVLSDSALVLMEDLEGRQVSLASYEDRTYRNMPKKFSARPDLQHYWNLLASRQISNVGDMEAGSRFVASMSVHGSNVVTRNACNMTVRDFMSGNFILLGTAYSNPWSELFSKNLNFQITIHTVRNLKPSKGEKSNYLLGSKWKTKSLSYAHVALVPNLTNTGRVLLVAGLNMQSTEAASDFLLDPSSTPKLRKILGPGNISRLPGFELLLQTSTIAGAPNTTRIVASRVYHNNPNQQK